MSFAQIRWYCTEWMTNADDDGAISGLYTARPYSYGTVVSTPAARIYLYEYEYECSTFLLSQTL